jgi:hypothetical protein
MASNTKTPPASDLAIRIALGYEVLANIPAIAVMLLYPNWLVDYLKYTPPATAAQKFLPRAADTPLTASLVQWVGCLFVCFTIAVAFGMGRSPRAIHTRFSIYAGLLVTDAMLVGFALWQAFVVGEERAGVKKSVLMNAAASIFPYVLWRAWVLVWKPQWVGLSRVGVKEE